MPVRTGTEDLFPRGHARGQPSAVFAKNEGVSEKPEKRERRPENSPHGRLTPGATTLAIVTRCDERAVHFSLPSGNLARADPHETLVASSDHRLVDTVSAAAGENQFEALESSGMPLYAVLREGQVVRGAVIPTPGNAGTKHIQLSLQPGLVNAGLKQAQLLVKGTPVFAAVRSVEDHGYVLDFGVEATKGFLPFEEAADIGGDATAEKGDGENSAHDDSASSDDDSDSPDANTLAPGTPVEVVVSQTFRSSDDAADGGKKKKKKKSKKQSVVSTVRVSAKKDGVCKAETIVVKDVNFHHFRAGLRVSGKVLSVSASKAVLTVFGLFSVPVNMLHVPHGPDGLPSIKVGESVFARLLSVDPNHKSMSASLLPEAVKNFDVRAVPEVWKVGTTIKNLVVDRVDPTFGVFMRQVIRTDGDKNDGSDDSEDEMDVDTEAQPSTVKFGVPLFAHISRVSEKRPDRLEKLFYKGQTLSQAARIVSVSVFDGIVNVDLRPSILSRAALDITEVKTGMLYNCKVISHLSSGAISVAVDGDFHIRGIIPKRHISDTSLSAKTLAKHPNLRVGGTVKCVALYVNEKRQTIYLSARKSFVSTTDSVPKESLSIGGSIRGFVNNVDKFGAFLSIGLRVIGRVKLSNLSDDVVKEPEKAFPIGHLVEGWISDVKKTDTGETLIGVSLRKKKPKLSGTRSTVTEGEVVKGTVSRVEKFGAIVKLDKGNSALLHMSEVDQDRQVKDALKQWSVGQQITAVVIDANEKKRRVGTKRSHFEEAGMQDNEIDNIMKSNSPTESVEPKSKKQKVVPAAVVKSGEAAIDIAAVKTGMCYNCKVISYLPSGDISVSVDGDSNVRGVIPKDHISDTTISVKALAKHRNLRVGGTVKCVTLYVKQKKTIYLSARKSFMSTTDPVPKKSLSTGSSIRGIVNNVNKFGAFLSVGLAVSARIKLSDLSDDFVKDPEKAFPIGHAVEGKIVEVEKTDDGEILLGVSLRTKPKAVVAKSSLAEGEVVKGTVSRVERFGAIVKLDKGNSALLHTSEVDHDREIKDAWKEWNVGQKITAVVIDCNEKKRRVGTKRCHFEAAGMESDEIDNILKANSGNETVEPKSKEQESVRDTTMAMEEEEEKDDEEDHDSRPSDVDASEDANSESDSNDDSAMQIGEDADDGTLQIAHTFSLEEDDPEPLAMETEGIASDEEGVGAKTKDGEEFAPRKAKSSKEKREKKRAKEVAEREIHAKEQTLAANPDSPETADDFERMLLGEPNSSAIWIRYMAFRVSLSQIDKARAVAERALETIELTQEMERGNIWMAYVNLEASFGGSPGGRGSETSVTKAAAVFRVFDRASKRVTDVQDFYLQVFASLKESEAEIADEVMARTIKQFKYAKEVWIAAGSAKFERGDAAGGRKMLERALISLEKREHVVTIVKFAQMEYRLGSVERARTVFESLIGNYPKRLDVWSVFLDMEAGVCGKTEEKSAEREEALESTRLIFERCASLELSTKKMKSVFKKWVTFEKRFGDKGSLKSVMAKAKQYVESKTIHA